jgi:predicted TIM-barrel fold metal-dependent hydrolase
VLAGRVDLLAPVLANVGNGADVASLRTALKTLHFDLAGAPVEEQLAALLAVADPSRLHYGSDYPFTPFEACQYLAQQLQTSRNLDGEALDAVVRGNADQLLRRATSVG